MVATDKLLLKMKTIFFPCEENNFQPKFLESRFLFYYFVILLILKVISFSFFIYFPKTVFFADITKAALIETANQERNSLGIDSLEENQKLNQAAFLKAKDILEKDYFSHWSPDGISPWYWFEKVGYKYKSAGENLAIGFLDSEEVNQAWLNSPSHKENLLNPNYQEIGIGIAKDEFQGNEITVVVQLFGTPRTEKLIAEAPVQEAIKSQSEGLAEIEEPKSEEEAATETESVFSPKLISPLVMGQEESVPGHKIDYYDLTQDLVYGFLIFIIVSLLINISVRPETRYNDLIFKTLGFISLLIIFTLVDKEIIISIISHNLRIY